MNYLRRVIDCTGMLWSSIARAGDLENAAPGNRSWPVVDKRPNGQDLGTQSEFRLSLPTAVPACYSLASAPFLHWTI